MNKLLKVASILISFQMCISSGLVPHTAYGSNHSPGGPGGNGGGGNTGGGPFDRRPKLPSRSFVKLNYDYVYCVLNVIFLYNVGECKLTVINSGIINEEYSIEASAETLSIPITLVEGDEVVISTIDGLCETFVF